MNDLQVFKNSEFGEIRTININNAPWFVAADVCRALEVANPRDALTRLDADEKGVVSTDTPGGKQDLNAVNEPGLYSLVLGSRKPEAKAFKRWVTHEVIPAIRQAGAYMTPETIEKVLFSPDTIIHLAEQIKALQGENRALLAESEMQQQIIDELKPKADYVDYILSTTDTMTVTQIAADYGMSAQRLNKILHEEHIQHKVNGQWILYREHMQKGYTKSRTFDFVRSNGQPDVNPNTEWTQKGRLFINDVLNGRGIFANIDITEIA